jgi:DNA-binding response OmpR family regulator
MDGYLAKPIRPAELDAILELQMDRKLGRVPQESEAELLSA